MYGGASPPTTGRRPTAPGKSAPAVCSGRREELVGSLCGFSKCLFELVVLPLRQEDPVIALRQLHLHLVLLLGVPADDLSSFQIDVDEVVRGVLVFLAG